LSAESSVWGANKWADDLLLTDLYNTSQYTASSELWGWNFVLSKDGPSGTPIFGYGLYKFSKDKYNYFYLDYRDDRFGNYSNFGGPYGHEVDLWIKFNIESPGTFYYSTDGDEPWISISNGDTLSIWEIKQMGNPTRDRFQPTTPSDLTVTLSNNRPLLSWNCSEPSDTATYEVWRKVMGGFRYLQTIEDWTCIHNNQAEDTTYSDHGFTSGSGYKAYYKIRAVGGDGNLYSPTWSNTVSVTGSFTPNARNRQFKVVEIDPIELNFGLQKAYPSPFNPSVTLSYELTKDAETCLEVYNIQGQLVETLVNTFQLPGSYNVVWQPQNLSAGVYLVLLRSGKLTSS